MKEKILTIEKLIKINVTKDDVLLLKAGVIERDETIRKIESELSEKIGCKVAIIPGRYAPVTILNKVKKQ
jgi:hypothetical protein